MLAQSAQRNLERAAKAYEDAAETDRIARADYAEHVEKQVRAA
jgi:hypothetical protein